MSLTLTVDVARAPRLILLTHDAALCVAVNLPHPVVGAACDVIRIIITAACVHGVSIVTRVVDDGGVVAVDGRAVGVDGGRWLGTPHLCSVEAQRVGTCSINMWLRKLKRLCRIGVHVHA